MLIFRWANERGQRLDNPADRVRPTAIARFINAEFYLAFEPFITAGALYLALTLVLVRLFGAAENRWLAHLRPAHTEVRMCS